jgi:hypothetical protein
MIYPISRRMLTSIEPEKAREVLQMYEKHRPQPLETNTTKIIYYIPKFIKLRKFKSFEKLTPVQRSYEIRLFVSVMLHLYMPEVYHTKTKNLKLRKTGFVSVLSRELGYKQPNMTVMIRDVIDRERIFSDFREDVENLILKL